MAISIVVELWNFGIAPRPSAESSPGLCGPKILKSVRKCQVFAPRRPRAYGTIPQFRRLRKSSIGSSLSAHEWSGDYICRDFDTCMNQNSSSPLNTSAQPTRSAATETRATTVLLTNHQTACLDEIAACLRPDTGKYMSRSAMLRAIVAAVLPLYPDWGQGESAADVQQRIATLLRRNIK
jgi:hypothetical protein